MNPNNFKIDNLQYCNWSKEIFKINREAKLDAVHVTVVYHENFSEFKKNMEIWSKHFQNYKELIFPGKTFDDIEKSLFVMLITHLDELTTLLLKFSSY